MPNPNLIQEREEEFDNQFIAIGADIEGMKRVEYRQIREHQVEQIKSFNNQTLHLLLSDIIRRIDERKRVLAKQLGSPNTLRIRGKLGELDRFIAMIKEYIPK